LNATRKLNTRPGRNLNTVPGRKLNTRPGRKLNTVPGRKLNTRPGRKLNTAPGRKLNTRPDRKLNTVPGRKFNTLPGGKITNPKKNGKSRSPQNRLRTLPKRKTLQTKSLKKLRGFKPGAGKSRRPLNFHSKKYLANKKFWGKTRSIYRSTNLQRHRFTRKIWCGNRPRHCHWWFNFCTRLLVYRPCDIYYCDWNFVTCDYSVGETVVPNTRLYLGVKGMILPNRGLGIESVDPGSPAALAGLQPGHVIVSCNGITLDAPEALQRAISQSGGQVRLSVLTGQDEQPATVDIQMTRLAAVSY
jgi:hypothetical protein